MIENNAVRVQLPNNIRIHPVIHVEHTAHVHRQSAAIYSPLLAQVQPFIDATGELVIEANIY